MVIDMDSIQREILAILRRNDTLFAMKLLTRAVNLEKVTRREPVTLEEIKRMKGTDRHE